MYKKNSMEPIIHIGYSKTGSIWFRKVFYPKVENSYYMSRSELLELIISPSFLEFDAIKIRLIVEERIQNKRLIICDDLLLGGLVIGYGYGEFIYVIAMRLSQVFPEAKIIIFIRNQIDVLESAYSHYIKLGGTFSVKKYLGIKRENKTRCDFWEHGLFNPSLYKYSSIIDMYRSFFNCNNVHVFLYEDFAREGQQFIDQYCNILDLNYIVVNTGLKVNTRFSYYTLITVKFLNHFKSGGVYEKNYYFNMFGIKKILTIIILFFNKFNRVFSFDEEIKYWIVNFYRESNNNLVGLFDKKKLKDSGYSL